jgi:hypothetical protein
MTKRHVSLPPAAEEGLHEFLEDIDRRLSSDEDICDVVEDVLIDLHGDRDAYERWQAGGDVSPAERVRLQGYDPCNSTLESEYYAEIESMPDGQFERSKHLFEECGDNCRFFKGITFTYGHNITVGTPAKSIAIKDGWESVAKPLEDANDDRREQRPIGYEIPESMDVFDEFGRDLSPPDA